MSWAYHSDCHFCTLPIWSRLFFFFLLAHLTSLGRNRSVFRRGHQYTQVCFFSAARTAVLNASQLFSTLSLLATLPFHLWHILAYQFIICKGRFYFIFLLGVRLYLSQGTNMVSSFKCRVIANRKNFVQGHLSQLILVMRVIAGIWIVLVVQ